MALFTSKPKRTPGKRGKLPPKQGSDKLPLRWLHEYTTLPAVTYPIDLTHGITDWKMLGNGPDPTCTVAPNGVGDCTFAAREHNKMVKAAANGTLNTETWETSNALVTEYLAYDNGQDVGANIADLLLAWYNAGRILAFAPVDHTNRALCDQAMVAFNGLYVGVSLTDDADQLFSEGKPWTVAGRREKPDPNEGHCIVKLKADNVQYDGYLTWGDEQAATLAWSDDCVEESWALITSEDQINPAVLAALRADINALGGTGGGTPVPVPAPTPTPTPASTADQAYWAASQAWAATKNLTSDDTTTAHVPPHHHGPRI